MAREPRFCTLLAAGQCGLAAVFGYSGLWQRSAILSRPLFEGQTLWDSTARFHIWPWPYKFAVISNMPALMAGGIASLPLAVIWPRMSEYLANLPVLLFVPLLWYWLGSRLDRRWRVSDRAPWIGLSIFTLSALGGAFLPIGYTGFLPYGFVVWVITALTVSRLTSVCLGIPIDKRDSVN